MFKNLAVSTSDDNIQKTHHGDDVHVVTSVEDDLTEESRSFYNSQWEQK